MRTPTLFAKLPEYISTPDSMEIDKHGNLVLSCPNFAEVKTSGVMVKLDKNGNTTKWFDVPVEPTTGVARNMGICFDKEENLYICDNQGWAGIKGTENKGRVLKIKADDDGNILSQAAVCTGMEHPNGVKMRGDYIYVTCSALSPVKSPGGKLVSGVYRFHKDDKDIKITNTMSDKNLFVTMITENIDCQYGADGIEFDKDGNMYVGNFGDGAVHKYILDADGNILDARVFAKDETQLQTTDGFCFAEDGRMFIADFSANAVCAMYPDGRLERIAQSPDCDGLDGGLDQPGEPRVWGDKLILSCFDLVTGPDKVNTAHEMPATLSCLPL